MLEKIMLELTGSVAYGLAGDASFICVKQRDRSARPGHNMYQESMKAHAHTSNAV